MRIAAILLSYLLFCQLLNGQVLAKDSLALVELYNSLDGLNWDNKSNWMSGPVATWQNITVAEGRVTKIKFNAKNNMSGVLPAALADLDQLTDLTIRNNAGITGPIPEGVWDLPKLEIVNFRGCRLTGPLPAGAAHATGLKTLDLGYNLFTGAIPAEYGTLTELRSLTLNFDSITGPIPNSLQNLTLLSRLELSGNFDAGPFPEWIGDLPNLGSLNLTGANLEGPLPESLRGHPKLYQLLLNSNHLSGSLEMIQSWPKLRSLFVERNHFTGEIRSEWFKEPEIAYINIAENQIEDLDDLSNLENIINLVVRGNKLGFDDLEPNLPFLDRTVLYRDQQKLLNADTLMLFPGQPLEIDAGSGGMYTHYTWYKDGGEIPGENGRFFSREQVATTDAGVYHCQMVNDSFPELALERNPVTVILDNTSAVYTAQENERVSVFPNPAPDRLQIAVDGIREETQVEIRDLWGRVQLQFQVNTLPAQIDCSSLTPGIYLLLLQNRDRRFARTFVKM